MKTSAAAALKSPFLKQNWRPVEKESDAWKFVCLTKDNIPDDLPNGTFVRTGPNPYDLSEINPKSYHFFSGDGMVHGVKINDENVLYKNQYVQTGNITKNNNLAGRGNTAMVYHNGSLYACDEGSRPYELKFDTLQTIRQQDFNGLLKHTFSAHPKVCPNTKELHFIGYGRHDVPNSDAFTHYSVVDKNGMLLKTVPINYRRPTPLIHDMAITENHAIFMDFPLYDMAGPTKIEDKTMFGILPRNAMDESEMIWIESKGMYGFHVANAWETFDEENSSILINLLMVTSLNFHFQRSNISGLRLRHFIFDLKTKKEVSCNVVSDVSMDFPIIDNRKVSKRTRYIYGSRLTTKISLPLPIDGLTRYDIETGETIEIDFPEGVYGGECQFVPKQYNKGTADTGLSNEDGEGYLLVLCYTEAKDQSQLVIYDALSMSKKPISIINMPARIPYGFHALWIYAEDENNFGNIDKLIPPLSIRSKL